MQRQLLIDLLEWQHSPDRKPLLLRGARQVGKTHLVRKLGLGFERFIEINFDKSPALKEVFDQDLDPARITNELSILLNKKIEPGNTLLFIDEIQEAPRAISALRYFYEDMPALHVIAAGSFIDVAVDQVGVPVGRIQFMYLYPLSFIEFLVASGSQALARMILNHPPTHPMSDPIHHQAFQRLGEYMAIGGMPEAVHKWITQKNAKSSHVILRNIKNAYEQDFSKYSKKNQIKYIDLLFKNAPGMIGQHVKFSNLSTDYSKRELEPALHLLEKAGILSLVFRSAGDGIPLGAQADINKFKIILLDIGLNQSILGLDLNQWFTDPMAGFINKGSITESFVGQELLAYSSPSDKHRLYYWHREQRSSQAEVDYLLTCGNSIIPIEVKGGHGGGLQSMRLFLSSHPHSPYGIRFSTHNYSIHEKIHSYPLYAVSSIVDEKERIIKFVEQSEQEDGG